MIVKSRLDRRLRLDDAWRLVSNGGWADRHLRRWAVVTAVATSACSGRATRDAPPAADAGIVHDGSTEGGTRTSPEASPLGDDSSPADGSDDDTTHDAGGLGACAPTVTPLRRLSSFEYDNTVNDLFASRGGHDPLADNETRGQSLGGLFTMRPEVSSMLAESYRTAARRIAEQATGTAAALSDLAPCAASVSDATWDACARSTVNALAAAAYRRAPTTEDTDALLALHSTVRASGGDFRAATGVIVEALLQSPEFLYRVELGVAGAESTDPLRARRPSGEEMAARLSYLLWGTAPDRALFDAAKAGKLDTAAGVKAEASRLLDDRRSHRVVREFFDVLFGLRDLPELTRDATSYPSFSRSIAAAMREEALAVVENEVFTENGSWPSLLTAPYTFLDQPLATFYGVVGVEGSNLRKVPLDTSRRLGLLTEGGVMASLTRSNLTSPANRGAFVANQLLCRGIPIETNPAVLNDAKAPDPSDKTGRARTTRVTDSPACVGCHSTLNPLGFALENYDAVGRYRETENDEPIDGQVDVPALGGSINGGVELGRKLAASPEAQACFADQWVAYAYGTALGGADACLQQTVRGAFRRANYNVRQLLIDLTQTDAFLFMPAAAPSKE